MTGVSVAPLFYNTGHDGIPGGWIEMVRHNFRSLGPLVQADRMVREYVTTLYAPAAESSRALAADRFHAGRGLAAWTQRVREALGPLSPSDVSVEVVYGAPGDDDEIIGPCYVTLQADEPVPGQHARFSGAVELGRPGPFGYTVRVLPNHELLASRAELGLVTYPDAPAGMTNGDLR